MLPTPGPADDPRAAALARLEAHGVLLLYEDNHCLAIRKPPGLPAQGGTGIDAHVALLLEAYRREAEQKPGRAYIGLVHRLDRNVGGVMVVAKTSKAAARLTAAFRDRAPDLEKTYLAWVRGQPKAKDAVLVHRLRRVARVTRETFADDPEGREAKLAYRVVGRAPRASRLEVDLITGVAHQIRAQLSIAGHPILGDRKYGGRPGRLLALFAERLVVPHPIGGAPTVFEAPLPEALVELDRKLGIAPPVNADERQGR